jgi:hypothetical protein
MPDYAAQIGPAGRITCPNNAAYNVGTGDFTVMLLVKMTGSGCLVNRQSGLSGTGWSLTVTANGVIAFTTGSGQGFYQAYTGATNVADGYWHHVAVVRQSGQIVICLDLQQAQAGIAGGATTPVNVSNTLPLLIGNDATGESAVNGLVEDVTVWNAALTAAQLIPSAYNQLTGREPGLVGFWAMDNNCNDGSPTGNNGVGTSVSFVPIFCCCCVYGKNNYAFACTSNAGGAVGSPSGSPAPLATRVQPIKIKSNTPGFMVGLVTDTGNIACPPGAVMTITDPSGRVYNAAQNDAGAYVGMSGGSVYAAAFAAPLAGTWLLTVTAPNDTRFHAYAQTVPVLNIPASIAGALAPVYGSRAARLEARSDTDWFGWVAAAAITVGIAVLTIATAPATVPAMLAVVVAVAVADTAIIIAAAQSLPSDPTAAQVVDAGANCAQLSPDALKVVFADANSDPATQLLYPIRREMYGWATSGTSFKRSRLNGATDTRVAKAFINPNVVAALQEAGVRYVSCSAHGQYSYLVGCDSKDVLRVGSYQPGLVAGKIFHFLACKSGKTLGADLVAKGATAFFGYTDSYAVFTGETDAFVSCDTKIDYQLLQGATAGAALLATQAAFQAQITAFENAGNHVAAVAMQDNLALLVGPTATGSIYGDPSATITTV